MTASSSTSEAPRARALRLIVAPGRAAGLVALLVSLVALLLLGDGPLAGLRLFGLDLVQRALPRQPSGTPVIIVAIDDDSLARFGQWPWPRHLVADLVARIHADHPTVLGIDVLWPEADRLSPAHWAVIERTLPADLENRLTQLPDHDVGLGEAIAGGPTVLGVAALRTGTGVAGPMAPVLSHGGDPRPELPAHAMLLRSVPEIDRGAQGHGLLSVDKDADGMVRRLPTLATVGGTVVPSLTLEMLRVATGAPRIDAYVDPGGIAGVAVGALALPTEADGTIRLALSPSDPRRYVSAADLIERQLPAGALTQRLVLLGVTGLGLIDRVITPLGTMPGVELHAQLLESVVAGRLASRPRWAPWGEAGVLLGLGVAMIALLPGRRLRWYAPAGLVLPLAFGGAAVAAWLAELWLLDAVLPTLGGAVTLVALTGGGLAEADAQRRRLRRELEAERLAAARLAGELEAARRIQFGILPRPQALGADPRFDLDAVLEPAKEVGGDLYEFFLIDRRHLLIAIGDVTGKGVPASLFMALGKALYKSCVLRGSLDPAQIMSQANREIARDNPEMLFITLFAGIIDLDTGRLAYCNAGHEQPYAALPGAPPRPLTGSGGPPLCVVDDFEYSADADQLRPGELLCLVTDGITEAMNRDGALLGHEPVLQCLAALPAGTTAHDALAAVRGTVARFVGGADPSDDLTALTVRWTGARASAP
jgi:serine phosphatase RsbU (regulator of sigma subunit)/CHASE2 domain-containing sensor protein